jgi:uncharacterized protein
VHDPHEGVTPEGTIRTGASRSAVAPTYGPILRAAAEAVTDGEALYLYGSVATGTAEAPTSDVDLLSVGVPAAQAARISAELSTRYRDRCREVSIAAATWAELGAATDAGYGLRAFLRHYGVHLAGADPVCGLPVYPADARAARGFNGDIAREAERWGSEVEQVPDVARLGARVARKTLLAVAGIVSVRDVTWSTDRRACAARWAELEPDAPVDTLVGWLDAPPTERDEVQRALDGPVARVVEVFAEEVGLWREAPTGPGS